MKGTVKFFNDQKGFGFIAGEDSKEYFVHKSGLAEGVTLKENDAVTFDVEEGGRGPKAVIVQKEGREAIRWNDNWGMCLAGVDWVEWDGGYGGCGGDGREGG